MLWEEFVCCQKRLSTQQVEACPCCAAGEGEYVAFAGECSCDGPVEVWLQNVVDAMRAALSAEFKAALPAYEERPRTKWLLENSVQNTVVVSRAFFTREINTAFAELEEGNEHALKVGPAPVLALPLACARLGGLVACKSCRCQMPEQNTPLPAGCVRAAGGAAGGPDRADQRRPD